MLKALYSSWGRRGRNAPAEAVTMIASQAITSEKTLCDRIWEKWSEMKINPNGISIYPRFPLDEYLNSEIKKKKKNIRVKTTSRRM